MSWRHDAHNAVPFGIKEACEDVVHEPNTVLFKIISWFRNNNNRLSVGFTVGITFVLIQFAMDSYQNMEENACLDNLQNTDLQIPPEVYVAVMQSNHSESYIIGKLHQHDQRIAEYLKCNT